MVCNTAIKLHIAASIRILPKVKARWRRRRKTVREDCMWVLIFTRHKKSVVKFYLGSESRKKAYKFALYPGVGIFILSWVSEKMQHSKMNACNVTNLLCKVGFFVVVLQVCCKILVVVLQLPEKTFMFPLPVLFLPVCSKYSSQ